jgi:hypothetical protein
VVRIDLGDRIAAWDVDRGGWADEEALRGHALASATPNLDEWAEFWGRTPAETVIDARDLAFDGVGCARSPDWSLRAKLWELTYGRGVPEAMPAGYRAINFPEGWVLFDDVLCRPVMLFASREGGDMSA